MADDYEDDAKPKTKKVQAKDDAKICRTALTRYARGIERERVNINEAYEDLKFSAGEQWTSEDIELRRGRPMLTVNRLPQFIRQITGDMRQMKPGIKVVPVDGQGDKDTADTIAGMIRYIENRSDAGHPYMAGADSQVRCGIGHIQVIKEYASDSTFNQELRITGVSDGVSVIWDPDAVQPSKEDAKWCIVPHDMSKDAFEENYPDANVEDFDSAKLTKSEGWFDNDMVRIAEYWVKKPVKKTLALLPDGAIIDLTDKDEAEKIRVGATANKVEERDGFQICRYLITAAHVLETTEWDGQHIPVVPVIGEEVKIGRKTVRHGLIRFARDPQRLYNYYSSTDAEVVALQPKAPFMATLKNVEKYEDVWATANSKAHPVLLYTPDPANGGKSPERVQPPVSSQGINEGLLRSVDDMKSVIGIYDPGLGRPGGAKSGKAIIAEQRQGNTGATVYIDNWTRAIRRCGTIIADMIPHVYDSERMIRIMGEDGKVDLKWINRATGMQVEDPNSPGQMMQQQKIENDVTVGAYDIVMDTGPSYATKRVEARDSMTQFIQAAPETAPVLMDLVAKAQDWPLADEVGKRLEAVAPPPVQKLIAKQKKESGDEEQPDPPTPQEMQAQQVQQQVVQLELENKRLANEKIQAEIAEIIAKTKLEQDQARLLEGSTGPVEIDPTQAIQTAEQLRAAEAQEQSDNFDFMHKTRMANLDHQIKQTQLVQAKSSLGEQDNETLDDMSDQPSKADQRHSETVQIMAQIAQGMAAMAQGFQAGLESLARAQMQPKEIQIQRDASGNIVGGHTSMGRPN